MSQYSVMALQKVKSLKEMLSPFHVCNDHVYQAGTFKYKYIYTSLFDSSKDEHFPNLINDFCNLKLIEVLMI